MVEKLGGVCAGPLIISNTNTNIAVTLLHIPVAYYTNSAGVYTLWNNAVRAAIQAGAAFGQGGPNLTIMVPGKAWAARYFDADPYAAVLAQAGVQGPVFRSIKRISQHLCAPGCNPDPRIGAIAPFHFGSRHLPPELRDFSIVLHEADWSRLRAREVTVRDLHLYQFDVGIQKQGTEANLLYLPQCRLYESPIAGNAFDLECYSHMGAPAYFCVFCRSSSTDLLEQPRVRTLSIQCVTTSKKSNVITELSAGQLYHLTQRNVHDLAEYDRFAYDTRQTILLSTEDIGLVGLETNEYQKEKRVTYRFSGTLTEPGVLNVMLIYNNRGLFIEGRRLRVVNL